MNYRDQRLSSSSHGENRHGALSSLEDLSKNRGPIEEPEGKSIAQRQDDYFNYRALSAVAEDC